jgi:sigma-B regulation protein RsbU (phosphoserine phosphatase)
LRSNNPGRKVQSLEDENQRLKRAVEELTIINDLARAIGASLNSQEIMNTIIRRSIRAVNAEQGVITLVHDQLSEPTKTLVRTMSDSTEHEAFHLDQSLLGWMQINKKPLSMKDPHNDPRFRGLKLDASVRSLLCVPMLVKSELKGVLTVTNKKESDEFTQEDQRLLAIIAAQSAQIVETARLYEEEKALGRVREEIRLASEIQLGLLPKTNPEIQHYQIAGFSMPAQVVGGDYFDFIRVDDNRLAICLGDVSGKGLPAALLMSNLQATIRGQTVLGQPPKECMKRSNRLMYESTDPHKFATLFYGIMDTSTHRLAYSNAGHDLPYFFSEGKDPLRLESGGLILSVMEDFAYEEAGVDFSPGDLLVVFSDGITEATNEYEEQFGEDRLLEVLLESTDLQPEEIIEKLTASVNQFAGGRPQMDDMTLVVLKRNK